LDRPTGQLERRTLTPAVLASALFVAASAVFAVTFIAGRGGLEMPVASRGAVGVASPPATPLPAASDPPASPGTAPTPPPTAAPTAAPPTLDPNDPLLALPGCPGHPGCFMYVVQRDDSLSGIVGRYALSLAVVLSLNPEISDPSAVVTGTTLYLGRDPFVRLDPCPDKPACFLYVVAPGDSLAEIAARYGLTVEHIREQNPGLPRPLAAGQVIELPPPG
jgi:LysM domain